MKIENWPAALTNITILKLQIYCWEMIDIFSSAGLSELFLVGGCVKKVGGCDELKTGQKGGLHTRFLHLN